MQIRTTSQSCTYLYKLVHGHLCFASLTCAHYLVLALCGVLILMKLVRPAVCEMCIGFFLNVTVNKILDF